MVKYLGRKLVENKSNEEDNDEEIKKIIKMEKEGGKKMKRVEMYVKLNGIKVVDIGKQHNNIHVYI
jgi:hypothetical protein